MIVKPPPCSVKKAPIVGVFLLLLVLSRGPAWITRLIQASNEAKQIGALLSSILAISLPLYCSNRWQEYASFDKTMWTRRWQHFVAIPLVGIGLLIWSCLVGYALSRAGWHKTSVEVTPVYFVLNWILLVLFAPVAEEIFWRGYTMDQFGKLMSPQAALWLQAILFTAVHIPSLGWGCIAVFGYGVGLGYYRRCYGGLLPIMICHGLINFVIALPNVVEFLGIGNG
jgi:membrane protease YdiL (CAAX protease family)